MAVQHEPACWADVAAADAALKSGLISYVIDDELQLP